MMMVRMMMIFDCINRNPKQLDHNMNCIWSTLPTNTTEHDDNDEDDDQMMMMMMMMMIFDCININQKRLEHNMSCIWSLLVVSNDTMFLICPHFKYYGLVEETALVRMKKRTIFFWYGCVVHDVTEHTFKASFVKEMSSLVLYSSKMPQKAEEKWETKVNFV